MSGRPSHRPITLRTRGLDDAGLDGEPLEVLKSDERSRVWFVSSTTGVRAVKRFQHSPLRQRLALAVGLHPAQRELRWNTRLQTARVPVVPIVDGGIERDGFGARAWLATPVAGESLERRLRAAGHDPELVNTLVDLAADLAVTLLRAGLCLKDFKPSNIIVENPDAARLIDVGGTRRYGGAVALDRTLAVMDRGLRRVEVDEGPRRRFADRVRQAIRPDEER